MLAEYMGSLFGKHTEFLRELVTTVKHTTTAGSSNTAKKTSPLPRVMGPQPRAEERNLLAVSLIHLFQSLHAKRGIGDGKGSAHRSSGSTWNKSH